jgi:hypothetical protein
LELTDIKINVSPENAEFAATADRVLVERGECPYRVSGSW